MERHVDCSGFKYMTSKKWDHF